MTSRTMRPGTLVIASCSRRKASPDGPVPALDLYTGGIAPQLRFRFGHHVELRRRIYFLSARHGLVAADTPLGVYDQQLTAERAHTLRPAVNRALRGRLAELRAPAHLLLVAEPRYLTLLTDLLISEDRPFLRWIPDPRGWAAAAAVLDEWNWP